MNDEVRKNDINAIPPQARLALAAALIKSLPRESLDEMVDAIRRGDKPIPDIEIINGIGMSQQQLEEAIGEVRLENGRRAATPEEVVVSQVITPALHESGDLGRAEAASRHDIAIAFIGDDGQKPGIFEFVYDSRRFERVDTMTPLAGVPEWLLRAAKKTPVPEDA